MSVPSSPPFEYILKIPKYSYVRHPLLSKPYALSPRVTQEKFDDSISYEAKADDLFLVSYPKCGSTWTATILKMLRDGPSKLEGPFYEVFPFLEKWPKSKLEAVEGVPRLIKTHLYFDLTPWNPAAKYIVVARNPKDCFTSFYYHTVGFRNSYEFSRGRWDDYFELAIKGEVNWGDYFKCVGEWYEKTKTESNILFLLYEDMRDDLEREVLKIADFFGPAWGDKARSKDGEILASIVKSCTFEAMKKDMIFFPDNDRYKRPDHLPFLRKGEVGDWRNLFSEEQSKRTDEKLKKAEEKYPGLDRLWKKWDI